ncbi:MAG: hypothetical protein IJ590_03995 [Rickettsiales bacterium]|nr:hypothetical protein [Rickettsiales bacterium]
MFYFTYKNHKWLVEDRKKQIEQETINKLNTIFSIIAENSIANSGVHPASLPSNITRKISVVKIPADVVYYIDNDIRNEISNERWRCTNNYKNVVQQIIQQYRNGTRLNDTDFNKLRSYFKDNKHIEECYNVLTKSP